jgi:hypothetical protein
MKAILFMDDDQNRAALAYQRFPPEKRDRTIWCETAVAAIDVLENYELDEAHLDHDLGGDHFVDTRREDCGMEVVRWIEHRSADGLEKLMDCQFIIHSWNIPAGRTMTSRLQKLGLKVIQKPFGS